MIGYWVVMALLFCAIAAVLAAAVDEGASDASTNRTEQLPPVLGRVLSNPGGDARPILEEPSSASHPVVTPPPEIDTGNRKASGSTVVTLLEIESASKTAWLTEAG